ncbi:hypothetical protein GCM10022291_30940 [Postechiella marina]|uniref:Uncharacterized protein n=1 Tax=Postechiella marina TaxID=943941 RepID=A0ABP8CGC0_9FLAO
MRVLFTITTLLLIMSCKQNTNKTANKQNEKMSVIPVKASKIYPDNISGVFKAHGGIDTWNTMKSLVFEFDTPNGIEKTLTALKSRKALVETDNYKIGFDGEKVWLKDDASVYKGNAKFYYNLRTYFYAMPFILGDDGINYENVEPLVVEGETYPGVKISYNNGVGLSSGDEYVLYFDAKTHKMTWLSYTVTYFTKEKSEKFSYIKYSNWQTINGLLLPETLTWYKTVNNKPTTTVSKTIQFNNVSVSKTAPSDAMFKMVDGAKLVE